MDMTNQSVEPALERGRPGRPRRPRSIARRIASAISLLLTIAIFSFIVGFWIFGDYVSSLSTPADPMPSDAIIVVTGGKARLEPAVALLKAGKGKKLLVSGVHPTANLNDLRAATGGDRDLFSCCVDIDYDALDTIGNAAESAKWLRDHAYASAIVVTNNYHMPRTLMEMQRAEDSIVFVPYPVVNTPLGHGHWLMSRDVVRVLFTEYVKYVGALVRQFVPDAMLPASITRDDLAEE
jgi:uncharacterized SAM-binding protein YcdF (DUF218 family)